MRNSTQAVASGLLPTTYYLLCLPRGRVAMPSDVPASELIRRCRAGEAGAREQLFDRYQAYLQVLARAQLGRHLRGKCDSCDVVQMTLLEAHRYFADFQGQGEPE